jgi:hypothetical protein
MSSQVRHSSLSQKPETLAVQAGENARDTNEIGDRFIAGYLVTIARYAAVGSTEAKIGLEAPAAFRPRAVQLVRARKTFDAGSPVVISPALNFYHDQRGLGAFEPSGLVADEFYDLTFMVLE